jgi:luciferase family oxidoreductase group 1
MKAKNIRLSILDQSQVKKGDSPQQAISETIKAAKLADQLGYTRFWVSEHHNSLAFAGSTPEILVTYLAEQTKNIRIGSGGVMLSNYSPLKVAENFRMLEVLYPGRIDLGLGRASGTTPKTAEALNPFSKRTDEEFVVQLKDLVNYLHDTAASATETEKILATPQAETTPPIWMLSSGGQSAKSAAQMGAGLSFAHFIRPVGGPGVVQAYRDNFQPSAELPEQKAMVTAFVFCSEDKDLLRRHQAIMDYRFLQHTKTGKLPYVIFDEVKDITYTSEEQEMIVFNRQRLFSGTPGEIKPKLDQLISNYKVDELMVTVLTEGSEERLRSYELLADIYLKS